MVAARHLSALQLDATSDDQARLVLADLHEERGQLDIATLLRDPARGPMVAAGIDRPDVMRIWLQQQPDRDIKHRRNRIESITDAERAKMASWAKRWIKIGLSTECADRPMFEAAIT